ncbi:MAG: hypothetical protein R3175_14015 [Marinobacter sp.]|uniref:hypothetical protein n=1 Tax=Marinobacter sp. TaxID=50741 RepID=UPI00299D7D8E|nr:hypothetical protein [Marinobacter sp.]MDX1757168.1 hypothetical protein [Marinobacter sp.]
MSHINIITFEGISEEPRAAIPDGYQGFDWVSYDPMSETYGGEVYAATGGRALTSGRYSVKGLGFRMKASDGGKFDVRSAVIAADGAGFAMDVTMVGQVSGTEVFRKLVNPLTDYGPGPTEVEICCSGVDEFVFIGSAIESFDVDNIKVAVGAPGAPRGLAAE